jgi:hypothetical protein
MRGVYLVAAELAARGLVVSPTSRSAAGADLLVTDESCSNAYSVQVKTNGKRASFWLVGRKAMHISSRSHVYVFVNIGTTSQPVEYYIVPSKIVAKNVRIYNRPKSTWYAFDRATAEKYLSKWSTLGASNAA